MAESKLTDNLKNISEKDRKQIEQAQEMLGPDPETMGFVKNLFWGNYRSDLMTPFPVVSAEETARCDQMLACCGVAHMAGKAYMRGGCRFATPPFPHGMVASRAGRL